MLGFGNASERRQRDPLMTAAAAFSEAASVSKAPAVPVLFDESSPAGPSLDKQIGELPTPRRAIEEGEMPAPGWEWDTDGTGFVKTKEVSLYHAAPELKPESSSASPLRHSFHIASAPEEKTLIARERSFSAGEIAPLYIRDSDGSDNEEGGGAADATTTRRWTPPPIPPIALPPKDRSATVLPPPIPPLAPPPAPEPPLAPPPEPPRR